MSCFAQSRSIFKHASIHVQRRKAAVRRICAPRAHVRSNLEKLCGGECPAEHLYLRKPPVGEAAGLQVDAQRGGGRRGDGGDAGRVQVDAVDGHETGPGWVTVRAALEGKRGEETWM